MRQSANGLWIFTYNGEINGNGLEAKPMSEKEQAGNNTDPIKNRGSFPLQHWFKWLCYFPPEFYALAYCAGIWYYTDGLSPDMAVGMTVVAVATNVMKKL